MSRSSPEPTPTTDLEPRRRLRRMRAVATALLVVMAATFAVTSWLMARLPEAASWLGALRAFAEAALIGGLADWFAVTALFRRPLGLPIPHTAIVPSRKDDIGRALARFIRDHFLVREAIERRLDRTNLGARLGAWLAQEGNAARVTQDLAAALAWLLRAGDGNDLRAALGGSLRGAFDSVPVSAGLAALLEVLLAGPHAQTLIDKLVEFARAQLDSQRVLIRVRIHERSPWWLPKFVDQEIFDQLVGEIERMLDAIATDPSHPARAEIGNALKSLQGALAHDAVLAERSRELQRDVIDHPSVRAYAHDLWQRLDADLHGALADPDSPLRIGVQREISAIGTTLATDALVAEKLNGWLKHLLLYLVENYRDPLSEIVSETIEQWDPKATSRRIELAIGTDLQFIRLNGTVVGGLVGVLIYLAWQALN
jgi:uncharacterized membrane-anchored protein YjiN (DUF445 family)